MKTVLRYFFLIGPLILSYLGFLIMYFGGANFFGFIAISPLFLLAIFLILLLFFLNIATPDLHKLGLQEWKLLFLVSFLILVGIFWGPLLLQDTEQFLQTYGFQLIGGLVVIGGIFFLLDAKASALDNRIKINFWMVHYAGVIIFSLFVALMLSMISVGKFKQIPFSCEQLQNSQESFYGLVLSPVVKSNEIVQDLKKSADTFLSKNLGEVLEGYINADDIIDSESPSYFQRIKQSVIVGTLANKKEVDKSVCGAMTDIISQKRNEPGLQYSVIGLLFLLLYPILSIIFLISTVLSYLFATLLKILGLWTVTESLQYVQDMH